MVTVLVFGAGIRRATSGRTSAEWTDRDRREFIDQCVAGGDDMYAFCNCALEHLEARYDVDEMERLDRQARESGEIPEELLAAFETCPV